MNSLDSSKKNKTRKTKIDLMEIERVAKLEAQVEGIKEDVAAVKQDIRDLHSRITTGNREIMEKIDDKVDELAQADKEQHAAQIEATRNLSERVDTLERWRWMVVGGAVALGYILSKLPVEAIFG
jgi:putative NADH-flavin reductase